MSRQSSKRPARHLERLDVDRSWLRCSCSFCSCAHCSHLPGLRCPARRTADSSHTWVVLLEVRLSTARRISRAFRPHYYQLGIPCWHLLQGYRRSASQRFICMQWVHKVHSIYPMQRLVILLLLSLTRLAVQVRTRTRIAYVILCHTTAAMRGGFPGLDRGAIGNSEFVLSVCHRRAPHLLSCSSCHT